MFYHFLPLKRLIKVIRTVKISRRPISIRDDITHLPNTDISENDIEGPVVYNPGPELPKPDTQLKILSSREQPLISNSKIPIKKSNRNIIKKLSTRHVFSSSTTSFDTLTEKRAFGCINCLETLFIDLMHIISLIIFIPPLVEPAQAPLAIIIKVGIRKRLPHKS